MATIAEFLQQVNDTKPGECFGKCGKMVTEQDKDHAYCDECWDREIAKMPKVHVTFFGDEPDKLMKPPPAEVRVFRRDDPPSDISSASSEEEEPELKRSANAWLPPHLRKKAPGPVPLVRKKAVEPYIGPREKYGRGHRLRDDKSAGYDLSLQCDEEFRSPPQDEEDDFTDYCPGCESGCDADSAHRSGHEGDGYHPDCYMNAQSEDESWAEEWAAELDAKSAPKADYDEWHTLDNHLDYGALLRGIHNIQLRGGSVADEKCFLNKVCDSYGHERFQFKN